MTTERDETIKRFIPTRGKRILALAMETTPRICQEATPEQRAEIMRKYRARRNLETAEMKRLQAMTDEEYDAEQLKIEPKD